MTIFEQILVGLQQKFAGVDTATLTRIATKKAEGVTDETKVTSIVEGISFQDVMQNYGDFRAGQAQTSAVSNYEKKHGLKDGKPIEIPKPEPLKPNDPPKPQETDIAKMIADGIAAGIKPFADELASFKAERAHEVRNAQILAKAKEYGISEKIVPMLNIPSDADLDAFMKDAKQTFVNAGMKSVPPENGETKPKDDVESLVSVIDKGTKEIEQSKTEK
jgi:hypothetical protein